MSVPAELQRTDRLCRRRRQTNFLKSYRDGASSALYVICICITKPHLCWHLWGSGGRMHEEKRREITVIIGYVKANTSGR